MPNKNNFPAKIPGWRFLVNNHTSITQEDLDHEYPGSGTHEDPILVSWTSNDCHDPHQFSLARKLRITFVAASSTLVVSMASSAYSGSVDGIMAEFNVSAHVAMLGLSLYVLGFAIGPLFWAPLSEVWGRQISFFFSLLSMAAFLAGCAAAPNIWSLCILRFCAGSFGSAPLSNAGGTISDLFQAKQRGLALSLYAAAPFLGPSLGPIIGGFLGTKAGWRWVEGFLAIAAGVVWILATLCIPETYAPVLLVRRAEHLSKISGKVYRSAVTAQGGQPSLGELLRRSLSRPLVFFLSEPIVTLSAVYTAIVYGTLYMLFAAFPIVFEDIRGWSSGLGGLAFLGVLVGMILGITCTIFANFHYTKVQDLHNGYAPPETRLILCMPGALAIPISQFWFAWTNSPSIHWSVCITGTAPFGIGVILVYLGIMNYLIDSYTIYAASVLAANTVLRSIFGAVFPSIAPWMYNAMGIHWAPSLPAFLSLLCMPFPFVFYRYGASIRRRCKYSAESEQYLQELRGLALGEGNNSEVARRQELDAERTGAGRIGISQ